MSGVLEHVLLHNVLLSKSRVAKHVPPINGRLPNQTRAEGGYGRGVGETRPSVVMLEVLGRLHGVTREQWEAIGERNTE
jgi:hypothetical protein